MPSPRLRQLLSSARLVVAPGVHDMVSLRLADTFGFDALYMTGWLVADGDTGYGGLLNVRHTVRGYEEADAAAIQLEDQDTCGKVAKSAGIEAQ